MLYPEQITLKQLRTLEMILSEGTISGAAERLGLTAPAVHNQLKKLEDAVGVAIVTRGHSERFKLTPPGEVLLKAHEEITASLNRSIGRMQALKKGQNGRVILGVVSTGKYIAPRIVAHLMRFKPDIDVILKVGNRRETIEALNKGEFDLCIMGRPPRSQVLNAIALSDNPHVIIAAPDHPLVGLKSLTIDDISHERFIMREPGSGTRVLATRFLSDGNFSNENSIIEMSSNETIKQAVMSGLGIALLSAHTVLDELAHRRIALLDLKNIPITRKWFLISPDTAYDFNEATRIVREWIIEHVDMCFPKSDFLDHL